MTAPNYHSHQGAAVKRWRKWHSCTVGTAVTVVALLLSTVAWLLVVFPSSPTPYGLQLKSWQGSPRSWTKNNHSAEQPSPSVPIPQPHVSSPTRHKNHRQKEELSIKHILFGIAGSSGFWKRRKEFVRLWWLPGVTRGHVWLEEPVLPGRGDHELPPVRVSENISRFSYTNPFGQPYGLRISRIVSESFRLQLPDVRWFVLCDDDTIVNVENLVAVLSKYDYKDMFYIGSPSESHTSNFLFSHSMAFGGGGIAISQTLAKALHDTQDDCLERYPYLFGSDDRLHACITELGIPLTIEPGFHQCDIRGIPHGFLSSHPIAPFVTIHHVETFTPFYPGLSSLGSLELFTNAMRTAPRSFLQQSVCYDHENHLTFSVSLGYAVQMYPSIVLPRELRRSELTFSAWNGARNRESFDFDTRDHERSFCKKPILFHLKGVTRTGNGTLQIYGPPSQTDETKKKLFCFPRFVHLKDMNTIEILVRPLGKDWHLVPRQLCCQLNKTKYEELRLTVGQCEKRIINLVTNSM